MDLMRSYLPLPNELFCDITEYIAFTPELPDSPRFESFFKHPSPELLALSAANWQLRQICLPLLFANIKIRHDEDANQLKKHLALCVRFTKTLAIDNIKGRSNDLTQVGEQILSQILPQLEQLVDVKLPDCWYRRDLLKMILAHPTVSSVFVNEMPNVSMCNDDLSKVILADRTTTSDIALILPFINYLDHGMRIMSLRLESIDNQLTSHKFPGLQKIAIHYIVPASFSWLSPVLSTHPTLNELWLLDIEHDFLAHDTPPFLSSLIKESQGKDLQRFSYIWELGLRRARPIDGSSQAWHVMALGLTLRFSFVKPSSTETLGLVPSIFPKLEVLTIDFRAYRALYDIDELASILARFSSLSVLYLKYFFGDLNLNSGNKGLMRQVERDGSTDSLDELRARVKSAVLLPISRLAKQARTLESIHIDDIGHSEFDDHSPRKSWNVKGWLRVLNGNRDVGGTLSVTCIHPRS
ncbi:hypothetical protein F5878DRAFT_729173 [Lentinula raphanica]|uniref:Uncharacterized protein n=1 Tax=Lentinula raphanica TaxID=153919 RepID=A0AA38NY67_9AGAR|nr:hypothetical protein F5878DRAFT_729173 [Lentinula raphanica]